MHDLGLETSLEIFVAFIRCIPMENQPWPQFQCGIWERSFEHSRQTDCKIGHH